MNSNIRKVLLLLVLASFATLAVGIIPEVSAGGPLTPDMLIKIYFDPTTENWALDKGEIDINDWYLSKDFIDRWSKPGSGITLNEYGEIGKMEIDMNNQIWPTGGADPSKRSGAANVPFDPTDSRHVAAWRFRRAIAHLTNKPKFVTDFMKGQGYIMETEVPVPELAGYTDYKTLTNTTETITYYRGGTEYTYSTDYIYEYSRTEAIKALKAGGFDDWDGNDGGILEWKDIGDDLISGTADDGAVEELPKMKFWIRIDDPDRRQAGEDLANEMSAVGIKKTTEGGPLEVIVTERSACFLAVMVSYDYNFYTGGWSLTPDVDHIYDLYHSSMGQYAWAQNYPGFENSYFDAAAEKVKYPPSAEVIKSAAVNAQWLKAKYIPVIELWAAKGVKAYRTGWEGVVNMKGYGVDNSGWGWSFLTMKRTGYNIIKYGFKSDISALHVVSSEWLWDWLVLDLLYDDLLSRNPYNLPEEVGRLATTWSVGTWGTPTKTVVEFTLRTDATFHDGSPVKPADVAFSLLMAKAAGAGVAWNYPMVMDIDHVEIAGNVVKVFFAKQSAWALHWAGFMPIINKDLWFDAIGVSGVYIAQYGRNSQGFIAAGYSASGFIQDNTDGIYYPGTYANNMAVRDYHPWNDNRAGDGTKNDLKEDGGDPWVFESYVTGQTVGLKAFTGFYEKIQITAPDRWLHVTEAKTVTFPAGGKYWAKGDDDIWNTNDDINGTVTPGGSVALPASARIQMYAGSSPIMWEISVPNAMLQFFHETGSVNYPGGVGDEGNWYEAPYTEGIDQINDGSDLRLIRNSWGSTVSNYWGRDWGQYNLDTDITGDMEVTGSDLALAGANFGKKSG